MVPERSCWSWHSSAIFVVKFNTISHQLESWTTIIFIITTDLIAHSPTTTRSLVIGVPARVVCTPFMCRFIFKHCTFTNDQWHDRDTIICPFFHFLLANEAVACIKPIVDEWHRHFVERQWASQQKIKSQNAVDETLIRLLKHGAVRPHRMNAGARKIIFRQINNNQRLFHKIKYTRSRMANAE